MAYRISYADSRKHDRKRVRKLTVSCFVLFLITVYQFWPEGMDLMHSTVEAVKNTAVISALNQLAEDLVMGDNTAAAFSDFLRVLIP